MNEDVPAANFVEEEAVSGIVQKFCVAPRSEAVAAEKPTEPEMLETRTTAVTLRKKQAEEQPESQTDFQPTTHPEQ